MRFCWVLAIIGVLLIGCQADQVLLADSEKEASAMLTSQQATVVTLREGTDLQIDGLNLGILQILYNSAQTNQAVGVRIRFLTKPAMFNYHSELMLEQTINVANYQVQLLSIEQSSIRVAIRLTAEHAPQLPIKAFSSEQLLIAPTQSSVGDGYLTITIGADQPATSEQVAQVSLNFWVSNSVPALEVMAQVGQVIEYEGYTVRVLWLPNAAYPLVALGLQAD